MEIKSCKHEFKTFTLLVGSQEELEGICGRHLQGSAKVVAWFNHKVIFGRYQGEKIIWSEDFIFAPEQFLEFRAFNPQEELYIHDGVGRYMVDAEGEGTEYVDSFSRLWGEGAGFENGFVTLEDIGRKLKLVVPGEKAGNQVLWLRSYIGRVEETGQASYVAWRYLDIVAGKEVKNNEDK